MWLGITLAIITGLCIAAKVVDKLWTSNHSQSSAENYSEQQRIIHTPSRTVQSHQSTPNIGAENQAQNAQPGSSPNNSSSGSSSRPGTR